MRTSLAIGFPKMLLRSIIFATGVGLTSPATSSEVNSPAVAEEKDLDADGQAEIVMENAYLRAVLDRGDPRQPGASGYTERFLWGGWIRSLQFRPTAREFLLQPHRTLDTPPSFHGMPEEFEQPIEVDAFSDSAPFPKSGPRLLKIGVGLCSARPTGPEAWTDFRLETPFPWVCVIENSGPRNATVRFAQSGSSPSGHAYSLIKRVTLRAEESILQVENELFNTGSVPIATTWYLHPFFAPAGSDAYDGRCWATVPIPVGPNPWDVDTTPCQPLRPDPLPIWGALSARSISESWWAVGHEEAGDVLVSLPDRRPDWIRIWTWKGGFALEPFRVIDLAPGQVWRCSVRHVLGTGLRGVTATGPGGVAECRLTGHVLRLAFAPYRPRDRVRIIWATAPSVLPTSVVGRATPQMPLRLTGTLSADAHVDLSLSVYDVDTEEVLLQTRRRLHPTPEVRLPRRTSAVRVWAATEPQPDGRPQDDMGYLLPTLRDIGCLIEEKAPTDVRLPLPETPPDVVVLAGAIAVPDSLATWLAAYLHAGGGVFQSAPLSLLRSSLQALLPAEADGTEFVASWSPQGQNRRTLQVPSHRLHLTLGRDGQRHPLVHDLPLWPYVGQDIGRAIGLRARPEGQILLQWACGNLVSFPAGKPALVTGRVGQGRMVLMACPVAWGHPPVWVNYARLGEYHRELLVRCVQWAAGRWEDPPHR